MKNYFLAILAALGLVIPCAVFAQSSGGVEEKGMEYLLFDEIPTVKSAGFFSTKVTKAPGYVTVVTSDQVEKSTARTLAEIFDYWVPGSNTINHTESGAVIGTRGVVIDSSAKTMIMLDGHQLNHRQHFGYSMESNVPLLGDIGRYEIVNGPGAIVHGSGAINGFVNMVPKNGTDNAGGFVNVEHGFVEELYKMETGYGWNYGQGKDVYLYLGVMQAHGVKMPTSWPVDNSTVESQPVQEGMLQQDLDGSGTIVVPSTYKVKAFPDPTYKGSINWNSEDFHLKTFIREEHYSNGVPFGIFGDNDVGESPHTATMSLGVLPSYDFRLTDTDTITAMGTFMLMQQSRENDSGTPDQTSWDTNGLQLTRAASERHAEIKLIGKTTRFDKHSVAAGLSVGRKDFKTQDDYFHGGVFGGYEGATSDWKELGFFGEDVIEMTDKLNVSVGIRYDEVFYSPIKSQNNMKPADKHNTSYRLASAYEISDTQSVKLSYQTGFRYADMAYINNHSQMSNILVSNGFQPLPQLKPEVMKSWELNYRHVVNNLNLQLDANFYYNSYDNLLSYYSFPTSGQPYIGLTAAGVAAINSALYWNGGSQLNIPGRFRSLGFELVATIKPVENTDIRLSYGYTRPIQVAESAFALTTNMFSNSQGQWGLYPSHLVKCVTTSRFFNDKLVVSTSALYSNGFNISKYATMSSVYERPRFVVDLAVEYNITQSWSTKLTVNNAFDCDTPHMTDKQRVYHGSAGDVYPYYYLSAKYKF